MLDGPHFLRDSPGMADDQLSEVFDVVEVRGQLSGAFAMRGPWIAKGSISTPLKFMVMVRGRARLLTDGLDEPIDLGPGDVVILNNRSWLETSGGTGDGPPRELVVEANHLVDTDEECDFGVGGHVDLNDAGRALLLPALPPVAVVRAPATRVRDTIDRLVDEVTGDRPGSAFAIRQYGQLLILEVLRAYIGQADLPPSWLKLLTDERLRPAVTAVHADPGRTWRLDDLARVAAMSRTSFAERFRDVAGVPPLAYLNRWRMLLARRALRHGDARVGALAAELGYASESAFSTAFKREVGESPLRYRSRIARQAH